MKSLSCAQDISAGPKIVQNLHWGNHLCQFYKTKKDLFEILIPYFQKGLENNQYCIWITSPVVSVDEAFNTLSHKIPNFDQYLNSQQIEIIPYSNWYPNNQKTTTSFSEVTHLWIDKLNQSLKKGYTGLRITGDTSWLTSKNWTNFIKYEKLINSTINDYKITAICTYCLDRCHATQVVDILSSHQFAVIRQNGSYETIENSNNNRLKAELEQTEELQKKKNEFISIASHELKTPVTSIKGYTQILKSFYLKEDPKKIYLEKMDAQLDRLTKLVDDLLNVSQIHSGKLSLTKETFDLNQLITSIAADLQATTTKHQLIIKGKIKKPIYADKYRISQVLVNLLSNAIKFSPKADKVLINLKNQRSQIEVSVQDFGIGIKPHNLEKIFEPFYQANNTIRQSYSGLGLGLHISKEIIKKHQGQLLTRSKKGEGSIFSFSLPLK